jgi:hypothetical protein
MEKRQKKKFVIINRRDKRRRRLTNNKQKVYHVCDSTIANNKFLSYSFFDLMNMKEFVISNN